MAVTALEHMVLCSLREHGLLPAAPAVIELGESNWYGDVPVDQLAADLTRFAPDAERSVAALREAAAARRPDYPYELARAFFRGVIGAAPYVTIDPGTPGSTYRFDLNEPVPLTEQFDLVMNIGTAEHVFDVRRFYTTAHDLTRPGGLALHSGPCSGWPDHGFYTFQPTFFFDLARANNYEIVSFVVASLRPFRYVQLAGHDDVFRLVQRGGMPANGYLNVVFRRTTDQPFRVPTQAYYAGALSAESARLWQTLR